MFWLRFHPGEIGRLFPQETVSADGAEGLRGRMCAIANMKMMSSWGADGRATIPGPGQMTVDVDTKEGPRRVFAVDTQAGTARYAAQFEPQALNLSSNAIELMARPLPDHRQAIAEQSRDKSRPKVVSVEPSPGASGVSPESALRIRFDRPMDPFAARFDWESGDCLSAGYPSYNSNTFEFAIPMRLAPGVLHQVVVNKDEPGVGAGFISAQGRPAGLYVWRFTTGTGPGAPAAGQPAPAPALPGGSTGEAALNRFHQHYVVPAAFPALGGGTGVAASGSNAVRLLTLLEAMQRRRAQLTSLVEHAQLTTQYHGPGLRLISFQGTTFKWQRPSQYYGDVSQIMGGPFRVGGDGTNWWWETGSAETPDLVLCPTNEMQLQDISLADPFGSSSTRQPRQRRSSGWFTPA